MMFFADDFTPPPGIATWMSCLFWIVAGFLAVLKIVEHFKDKKSGLPQPLQIQHAQRLATHDELQQLRREFEASQNTMTLQISKLGEDNETRTRRLHERIEEMQKAVNAIPHQVIVLLRDAKGFHQ